MKPKGLLFDIDGVWHVGKHAVEGAADALARIRKADVPCRFITNTTARTVAQASEMLNGMGLAIPATEIINSPQAALIYLREQGTPSVHVIAEEPVLEVFREFPQSCEPDYVVVGDIGEKWNYRVLNEAFRMLMGGAELLAMHKGRYWQIEDGLTMDIGAFVAGLEYVTGKTAAVAGKPSPMMYQAALRDMGVAAKDALMVGDDLNTDIAGAQNAGIRAYLVKTGKYREDLVAASAVTPDAIIDSVASVADLL